MAVFGMNGLTEFSSSEEYNGDHFFEFRITEKMLPRSVITVYAIDEEGNVEKYSKIINFDQLASNTVRNLCD
jgi:hypothetical protein